MKSNINIYLESLKKEILHNNKRSDFLIRILEKRLLDPAKENINKHHIFPKSWGGPNNKDNFVKLTCSEHFKVHQLLSKVTIDKDKKSSMQSAYWRMSNCGKYKIKNHKEYERLRIDFSKQQSEAKKGKRKSEETKQKMREAKIGKPGKKHSEETKRKMSENKQNMTLEEKAKSIIKQKETNNNKSPEQKAIESKKNSEAVKKVYANMTQEEKAKKSKIQSEATKKVHANMTPEQKAEISRKKQKTWNDKAPEQKDKWKNKISETLAAKYAQEENDFIFSVFDSQRKNYKETTKLYNEKFRKQEDYLSITAIRKHIRRTLKNT